MTDPVEPRPTSLPSPVVALVGRLVPDASARSGLLGDLEERYRWARVRAGRVDAIAWLIAECTAITIHYSGERGMGMMDALRTDIGYAVRGLARRPGFSALVVATLALGIGANTAIFSVVDGLLFEPLPYAEAERLVLINQQTPEGFTASVSLPNYRDWKERGRSFDRFSAILPSSGPLANDDGAQVIEYGWVHGGFFETLGVEPALGRAFGEEESEPGAERVVVLAHELWVNAFGGDPAIVGRQITLRDEGWTVLGVMPPGFAPHGPLSAYLPMGYVADRVAWDDRGTGGGTEIFARLAPGVTPAAAQTELRSIGAELARSFGDDVGYGNLTPLRRWYLGDADRQALILMAAVALVLLVACANVANLLFVRSEKRRGELAVRAALGAGRGRIGRQLFTEILLFGLIGGVLGIAVGSVGLDLLLRVSGDVLPAGFSERIDVDRGVLLFTAAIALATTALAGMAPTVRSSRTELSDVLRDGGARGRTRRGARNALIAVEMAFSMILLVGAGLLISSLVALQNADRGFDGDDVLTVRVQQPTGRYGERASWVAFQEAMRQRVGAIPSVTAVASSNHFPLSGNSWEMLYRDENTPADDRGESVLLTMASPEFFAAYGIEIVSGRDFTDTDAWGGELVAIVDESLAATRWPGESPLGRRISFETVAPAVEGEPRVPVWRTVIGVASHVRHYELTSTSRIQVYTPLDQSASWGFTTYLSIQTGTHPAGLVPAVRAAISEVDPAAALYRVRTIRDVVDQHLGAHRAMRALLSVFAILTLLLGCIGIYSVVSHVTAQRVREIGVRLALGGAPSTMIRLVLRESMMPVVIGLLAGAVAAAGLANLLGSLLYEVRPSDPAALVGSALTLLVVAAFSAWIPARAAAATSPVEALSAE